MKKRFLMMLVFAALSVSAKDFVGLWTTVDDETKEKKSVVRIYRHEGMYFGRIVKLFKNSDAVAKLPDSPKILGLDIIWNMDGGKILDPKKGKVYSCEMWRDGENLIVRGKIAFLGCNQTWLPYKGEPLSQADKLLAPKIPGIK